MHPVGWHISVELSVSLSVCQSVRLSENLNFGHNFCNIEDRNLIFGMHVYRMELHILSGKRSRSSFKVRGQIYVAQIAYFMNTFAILKIAT